MEAGEECSENYYPDWSRATFLDIRNVRGVALERLVFSSEEADEREPYMIEACEVAREDILVKGK